MKKSKNIFKAFKKPDSLQKSLRKKGKPIDKKLTISAKKSGKLGKKLKLPHFFKKH